MCVLYDSSASSFVALGLRNNILWVFVLLSFSVLSGKIPAVQQTLNGSFGWFGSWLSLVQKVQCIVAAVVRVLVSGPKIAAVFTCNLFDCMEHYFNTNSIKEATC